MPITYKLIRSNRKTLGIEITSDGVVVRAPYRLTQSQIDKIVRSKANWIEKHLAARKERDAVPVEKLSEEDLRKLVERARQVIPLRVAHYAPIAGVTYGRITIRNQKTRWGSCSAKGNLNFNCLLMLTPPEVIDSVVVHELCHRKEMNHSEAFYREVLRVYPDYHKWNGWLKVHGSEILRKVT